MRPWDILVPKHAGGWRVLKRNAAHGVRILAATFLSLGALNGALQPSATALAAHSCPASEVAVHFPPPADAAALTWAVEGPISAFSRNDRTVAALGMTFNVPVGLMVNTIDVKNPALGNIAFADDDPATVDLTDPALEAVRSIVGATVIADGTTVFTAVPGGFCMRFVAGTFFSEPAENVLAGTLSGVDAATSTFVINGVTVRMNTDPRYPSEIVDIGGNPLTFTDLAGNEGALVTVVGAFDRAAGVLVANAVEAEVLRRVPGRDTVVVERAQIQQNRLRVRGLVSRSPATNAFVAAVDVFNGPLDGAGTGCLGPRLGSAPVNAVDGSWDFRVNLVGLAPDKVCVTSPGGGADDLEVTPK